MGEAFGSFCIQISYHGNKKKLRGLVKVKSHPIRDYFLQILLPGQTPPRQHQIFLTKHQTAFLCAKIEYGISLHKCEFWF